MLRTTRYLLQQPLVFFFFAFACCLPNACLQSKCYPKEFENLRNAFVFAHKTEGSSHSHVRLYSTMRRKRDARIIIHLPMRLFAFIWPKTYQNIFLRSGISVSQGRGGGGGIPKVYERGTFSVKNGISGRSLPVQNFVGYPPSPRSRFFKCPFSPVFTLMLMKVSS